MAVSSVKACWRRWIRWKILLYSHSSLTHNVSLLFQQPRRKANQKSNRLFHAEQELSSSWDGRPFSHNRRGPKTGRLLCPFPWVELYPCLTQCRLSWGLPPYQVTSWCIQPFGHNRNRPKIGGCAPFLGGSWVPISPMWPRPRPTSIHTGIS